MMSISPATHALTVEIVSLQAVYDFIEADHVSQSAFNIQLQSLMEVRVFEGHPLGFLVVWSKNEDANAMIGSIMDQDMHNSWTGKAFSENKGRAAQLLLLDGGTMLNCESGRVQAATVHFASHASCPFFLEGHGTKHQSAVNLSFNWNAVVMVRSVDSGDITIFSNSMTRSGRVARVSASAVTQAICMERSMACDKMMTTVKQGTLAKQAKATLAKQAKGALAKQAKDAAEYSSKSQRRRMKKSHQRVKSQPVMPLVHVGLHIMEGIAILWLCQSFRQLRAQR